MILIVDSLLSSVYEVELEPNRTRLALNGQGAKASHKRRVLGTKRMHYRSNFPHISTKGFSA